MAGLYQWIQNIVYYLLFVTVLMNLLPSGKYEKYLRLFAGCVLVLLVLQPLTGGLRLEDKITGIFERISFQNEAGELNEEILDMENRRLAELVKRYEEETERDIARLAALEGMEENEVSVMIDGDPESPSFGSVTQVFILLRPSDAAPSGEGSGTKDMGEKQKSASGLKAGSNQVVARTEKVKPVEIRVGAEKGGAANKAGFEAGYQEAGESGEGDGAEEAAVYPEEWTRLKRQIAGYYQVEEQYVEIRIENE